MIHPPAPVHSAYVTFHFTEVTRNANPLKTRENLAVGLPVVSRSIPEVKVLGHCWITETLFQFLSHLSEVLRLPMAWAEVRESMRAEGWESRLWQTKQHLGPILANKTPLAIPRRLSFGRYELWM
jgi:hypothetical protein